MNLEIKFAKVTREKTPHRCVSHVGGLFTTGKPWKVTVAEAVVNIESGQHQFYVMAGQRRVEVVVGAFQGFKYLKAKDDPDMPDRLLALGPIPI